MTGNEIIKHFNTVYVVHQEKKREAENGDSPYLILLYWIS